MAFSDARNEAARAATGRNATNHGGGSRVSRPSGPGFSPSYDSLAPNGVPPATGVLGGLALMGRGFMTGNFDPYGAPKGYVDQRSRDLGGIGRGNAGGGENRFAMMGQGGGMGGVGSQLDPALLQHLTANNPSLRAYFASQGTMPQAPQPNQVRADLLRSKPASPTEPKAWWRTPFPAPARAF